MRRLLGRARNADQKHQNLRRPTQPPSIDLVWDEAHAIAEAQERRHVALDGKTIPLLAFGLAFTAFLRANPMAAPFDSTAGDVLTGLVAVGLLGTLGAVLPRSWARVPDLATFVSDANFEPERLKERYLRNFVNGYRHNERVLQRKFRWFKLAVFMYIVALTAATGITIWPRG